MLLILIADSLFSQDMKKQKAIKISRLEFEEMMMKHNGNGKEVSRKDLSPIRKYY